LLLDAGEPGPTETLLEAARTPILDEILIRGVAR
jgi:hypothetical protein